MKDIDTMAAAIKARIDKEWESNIVNVETIKEWLKNQESNDLHYLLYSFINENMLALISKKGQ